MMNCEQSETLISGLIDEQITADDRVTLDAHLTGCVNCRATEEALRRQSADLRRAFTLPHRRASAVAERVSQQLCDEAARSRSLWLRPSLFVGLAAGFLIAVLSIQPWRGPNETEVVTQTQWMSPIPAAKGQDPELARRVEHLFEKLVTAEESYDCEQQIRALGDECSDPLMNILQSLDPNTDSVDRQRAARMLSELAGPSRIPMLISLLGDRGPQVRSYAERALVRLTGRTPDGVSSDVGPGFTTCGNPRGDWQAWWDENKHRYGQR